MHQFGLDKYILRRNVFVAFGAKFRVFDESKNMLLFCKQKAFKLKEDIRIYADKEKSQELITIKARQIVDFSAAYDITDSRSGEVLGSLKRKGWKSILRDEWIMMDKDDNDIGKIIEDSKGMALLRRFLSNLIPQKFSIMVDDKQVGMLKQFFNPFIFKATLDLSADVEKKLDRRFAIAAGILLLAIEGRQSSY